MTTENKTPSKLFKLVYKWNIIIIVSILIIAVIRGLSEGENIVEAIYLLIVLTQIFIITPLLLLLLLLNIWGAFKYKIYRVRFIIISVVLIPLILFGSLNWDIPLP